LQAAESDVFSKVRICEAQRSNESPSGAFKRQNGLAQQDGGVLPRQVHVCGAQRSNESPSGAFKRQNGLRQQMERPRPDKFAFAERSAAMKAPVGLLSDRTVLRSKMEGSRPRQVPFLCRGKQAVQTLRRKAPDSGKCANGVQKVCSRFPA